MKELQAKDLVRCALYQGIGTGFGLFIAQLLIEFVRG